MNKIKKAHNLYSSNYSSSRRRGHPKPDYTRSELTQWLMDQPLYHELYQKWEQSGFERKLSPSIDRIDPSKPYKFGNIQLMTVYENCKKSWESNEGKNLRKVEAYNDSGEFLGLFDSVRSTAEYFGVSYGVVNNNLRGVTFKTSNGLQFRYEGSEKIILKEDFEPYSSHRAKPFLKKTLDGKVIQRFESLESYKKNYTNHKGVRKCLKGDSLSFDGFIWDYEDYEFQKVTENNRQQIRNQKAVEQYSLDGDFIREFASVQEAEESLGICGVVTACKKSTSQRGGFQWKYKYSAKIIRQYAPPAKQPKPVVRLDMFGNYVETFTSVKEACIAIRGKEKGLRKALEGKKYSYYGSRWVYTENYEGEGVKIETTLNCTQVPVAKVVLS